MLIDAEDAEHLVRSTVRSFTKGLRRLIEEAERELQDRLNLLLTDLEAERECVKEERDCVTKERAKLDRLLDSLERSKVEKTTGPASPGPPSPSPGQGTPSASQGEKRRSSMRVIRFADEVGAKLDCASEGRAIQTEEASSFLYERPSGEPVAAAADAKDFLASAPQGQTFPSCETTGTLEIGHRTYAVLPASTPNSRALSGEDLKNLVITIPSGWDVLSTSADDFEKVIVGLTAHSWGTALLIVQHGEAFNTYRTPLSKTGEPGSKYKDGTRHLEPIPSLDTSSNKQFRYLYSTGRLVIFKAQADAAAGSISALPRS